MEYPSKIVEEAVMHFSRLPGIGKKTALRLVLHMLKQDEAQVRQFAESAIKLKTSLSYCTVCNNIADGEICTICADKSRRRDMVCVVEDLRDVMAIENTSQYKGLYHVLGGLISPIDGIGPEELSIDSLLKRLASGEVKELIMAMAATMEGDTTTFYISKKLKPYDIKVTAIARGISIGGELEYADEITLGRSISGRIPYAV